MRRLVTSLVLAVHCATLAADPRMGSIDRIFVDMAGATPGCAVAIADNGKVSYSAGYGLADVEWSRPITPDTVFDIASDTKQFIAFAILRLQRDGKLSLDDDVRRYVPELHEFPSKVTLRHLLQMTSGLPAYVTLAGITGRAGAQDLSDAVALDLLTRVRALDFEPGTEWNYVNSNYLLLVKVVERVSGEPWAQHLATRILAPYGLRHTVFSTAMGPLLPGHAEGYVRQGDGWARMRPLGSDTGGKGLHSTVGDMLLWARVLDTPDSIEQEIYRSMATPGALVDGSPLTYGFGLERGMHRGTPVVVHGGTNPGFRSQLLRAPKLKVDIALLCNRGDVNQDVLARRVLDEWAGDRLAPTASRGVWTAAHRSAAGDYLDERGQLVRLVFEGDVAKANGLASGALQFHDEVSFAFDTPTTPATLRVEPDGSLVLRAPNGRPMKYHRHGSVTPAALGGVAPWEGRYLSPEFDAVLRLVAKPDGLVLVTPDGEVRRLDRLDTDRYITGRTVVRLVRRDGAPHAVVVGSQRARQVRFERLGD